MLKTRSSSLFSKATMKCIASFSSVLRAHLPRPQSQEVRKQCYQKYCHTISDYTVKAHSIYLIASQILLIQIFHKIIIRHSAEPRGSKEHSLGTVGSEYSQHKESIRNCSRPIKAEKEEEEEEEIEKLLYSSPHDLHKLRA